MDSRWVRDSTRSTDPSEASIAERSTAMPAVGASKGYTHVGGLQKKRLEPTRRTMPNARRQPPCCVDTLRLLPLRVAARVRARHVGRVGHGLLRLRMLLHVMLGGRCGRVTALARRGCGVGVRVVAGR